MLRVTYGQALHRLEQTIDTKRIFQANPNPDLIASAYRRTVGAGEAQIVTNGTDDESEGSSSYTGSGVVWLGEGSAAVTTTVHGARTGTAVTRTVRNNMYVESPRGGLHWEGLPRTFGRPLNYPAENFTVPLFSLQYLSSLHTPVHRGAVTGPGIKRCRGYLTSADEHGGRRLLQTSVGVCLDSYGRIAAASFRYQYHDRFNRSHQRLTIKFVRFGVHNPNRGSTECPEAISLTRACERQRWSASSGHCERSDPCGSAGWSS